MRKPEFIYVIPLNAPFEMTAAMKKRSGDARAKGLMAEEYRRTIIRSHRKE
jgi:hypothetical protein